MSTFLIVLDSVLAVALFGWAWCAGALYGFRMTRQALDGWRDANAEHREALAEFTTVVNQMLALLNKRGA